MFFAFSHTIIFRIYIPVVSGVKVLFQGVRFICALEGRRVLYPLTPTSEKCPALLLLHGFPAPPATHIPMPPMRSASTGGAAPDMQISINQFPIHHISLPFNPQRCPGVVYH